MAEPRHLQRRSSRRTTETAQPPKTDTLQRKAGNRAVSGMIDQLRATTDDGGGTGGPQPWEHPTFERQADDIAARAKGMAGSKDRRGPLSGAPLAADDAAKLSSLTGKDVSRVRLHTDGASASTAASMGAHAYTSGTDIHFGRGEYDPSSSRGFELLAHEVTHAVQHPSGHDHAGNELVHAKLKGTKRALEDLGGGAKKTVMKSLKGSRWNELLSQLDKYEKLEQEYVNLLKTKGQKGFDKQEAKQRQKLLKALVNLEKVALEWRAKNDEEGAQRIKDRSDKAGIDDDPTDKRVKAERRQAVALFLTRVRVEKVDLERGQFGASGGLDDSQLDWGKDDAIGGGMNRLDEVAYASEDGPILEGYFKSDKGFEKQMAGHDKSVGISQYDPNYGARSVAMYRLDKLLQGGVIARTEFAVHTSRNRKAKERTPGKSNLTESTTKMGFVTEKAKGETMFDIMESNRLVRSGERSEQTPDSGVVAAEDPVLQSCLNKLQILDAIAGQLDRHRGNYFVQRDPKTGKVIGVTGIDNDMAFGSNMTTPDHESAKGAQNYVAMPELVDEAFGKRLLQISEKDIRDTLEGLLTPAEIDATVKRFEVVRKVVKDLDDAGQLTRNWDKSTLDKQVESSDTMKGGNGREKSMLTRDLAIRFNDIFYFQNGLYKRLLKTLQRPDIDRLKVAMRPRLLAGDIDLDQVETIADRVAADARKYTEYANQDGTLPELGDDWIETYLEGAIRGI